MCVCKRHNTTDLGSDFTIHAHTKNTVVFVPRIFMPTPPAQTVPVSKPDAVCADCVLQVLMAGAAEREHRTTSSRSTLAESRLTMPSGIGQRGRMPPRSTHVMRTFPWLARHPSRVGLPVLVAVEAIHAVQQPCIAHRCTVQRVVAARHAGAVRVDRAALIGAWGRVALTRLWPVRRVRNRTQRNKSTGSAKNLTLPVWPWSWGRCWAGPSA